MRLLMIAPVLLAVAACGGPGPDRGPDVAVPPASTPPASPADPAAPGEIAAPESDLAITVDLGDGSPPREMTLVCAGKAEGSHPDPDRACEALARVPDPFAEPPADRICTEQYGGPQTARITGTWNGRPVDVSLSRTDGCEISRWDSLVPVVPAAL